jgi:hypothetical protein
MTPMNKSSLSRSLVINRRGLQTNAQGTHYGAVCGVAVPQENFLTLTQGAKIDQSKGRFGLY